MEVSYSIRRNEDRKWDRPSIFQSGASSIAAVEGGECRVEGELDEILLLKRGRNNCQSRSDSKGLTFATSDLSSCLYVTYIH